MTEAAGISAEIIMIWFIAFDQLGEGIIKQPRRKSNISCDLKITNTHPEAPISSVYVRPDGEVHCGFW